jgi:hypothetical protein
MQGQSQAATGLPGQITESEFGWKDTSSVIRRRQAVNRILVLDHLPISEAKGRA